MLRRWQAAELGQVIFNFINLVPGGMVVFLPSYAFLNVLKVSWEASGLMDKLRTKKKVGRLNIISPAIWGLNKC